MPKTKLFSALFRGIGYSAKKTVKFFIMIINYFSFEYLTAFKIFVWKETQRRHCVKRLYRFTTNAIKLNSTPPCRGGACPARAIAARNGTGKPVPYIRQMFSLICRGGHWPSVTQ